MKYQQVTANIQAGHRGLHSLQAQISSGKRLQRPSDDPNAAAGILEARAAVRGAEQFQRNISVAVSRVEAEESVLNQLGDALTRALELAVSQAGDTANAVTRRQAGYEIDNLLGFAVTLGNTRFGEGFLFAGHQSDVPPFDPADPLRARTPAELAKLDQPHEVEISTSVRVPTNHNGKEIFLDTRAMEAIRDLSAALGANDTAAIRGAIDMLKTASEGVQDLLGDVGGRYNHLQITGEQLRLLHLSATTLRSGLEDVDMAKALVDVAARQSTLQAAMLSTSRILGLNLADYLR